MLKVGVVPGCVLIVPDWLVRPVKLTDDPLHEIYDKAVTPLPTDHPQSAHSLKIKLSWRPWLPPPQEMLKGTPICFSFSQFNSRGIISSKFSIMVNK